MRLAMINKLALNEQLGETLVTVASEYRYYFRVPKSCWPSDTHGLWGYFHLPSTLATAPESLAGALISRVDELNFTTDRI